MSIMSPAEARSLLDESRDRAKVIDAQRTVLNDEYRAVVQVSHECRDAIVESGDYEPEEFLQWACGEGKAHDVLHAAFKDASPYLYYPLFFEGGPAFGQKYLNEDGSEAYMLHPSLGFHVMLYQDMTDEACDDLADAINSLIGRFQPVPNHHREDGSVGWVIDVFDRDLSQTRNPMIFVPQDGKAITFDASWFRDGESQFETLADALRHERSEHYYEAHDRHAKALR
jgi:hypothetical protein